MRDIGAFFYYGNNLGLIKYRNIKTMVEKMSVLYCLLGFIFSFLEYNQKAIKKFI